VRSTQPQAIDPLNYAVERLWDAGIVVVVAAGNDGPSSETITKPADDPVVLTVGAMNDRGDTYLWNDTVPGWSSRGPATGGVAKPDLVAPGRTLIATRSYGSHVEEAYPQALISPSYIRGSGTSQASAVMSGVVALLLAARPDLTPDQVKDVLVSTAARMSWPSTYTQGAGRVQLADALVAEPSAPPQTRVATGIGSLEASRGDAHVVADCNGVSTEIIGEINAYCMPWDPAWLASPWNGEAWTGVSWKGAAWTGVSWKSDEWSEADWDGVSWKGGSWTGVSWKGSEWSGVSWKDAGWSAKNWTTVDDAEDEFLTAFWGKAPKPGRYLAGEKYTPAIGPPAPHRGHHSDVNE
jgi:serine protease AprX